MRKILLSSLVFLSSCNPVSWLNDKLGFRDDNIIEESIEAAAAWGTGVNVDFTPGSPE